MNAFAGLGYNNNHVRALDDAALRRLAPSVFAESAASDRSHRYTFIPTSAVIQALRNEGFYPVAAMESRARIEEKKGFTKHLVRLRRHDGFSHVGEVLPEICLMNSHDGTTSYQISAGLFRLVCSNGLIVSDSEIETIRARHSGNIVDDVIEGTYHVIERAPEVAGKVEQFRGLVISEPMQNAFAKAALELRYEPEEAPIQPAQLNRPRRSEDRGDDIWRTFNRVQENMIQGGIRGKNKNGGRMSTRAVNSVGENVRLNKALWTLAEEMRRLVA
ncbi:DUF932 domain-containing protein [Methylomagnum ishizawai]|uniref:DUF932 domain-containing protein n=1 Tax=Methylomagnum ishizawai TaxID=1760988 RepID=UPI001C329700|nr:DUF932 domain-containing protein [Methylomagnum ishizawai]BBL77542.1 hypothetical protein MishRS11D_46400 [Methylomagnum ishizawai]